MTEGRDRQDDFFTPSNTLEGTLDMIQAAESGKEITGVRTGFTDLDSLTNGLQPGQIIVVAARPGMGKSTLAMDFARACTMPRGKNRQPIPDAGRPAAFITLEMSIDELNMRALSAEGDVALHHLRSGTLDEAGWDRLAVAAKRYSEAPLYINESARSLAEIQAKCRRLKTRIPDLAEIIIDYAQLVESGGKRHDNREQEVSHISRSLKLLAKELHLPIILLSQLNRGPEMRADKRPQVSDLRESGSIEQDADMVILLYRDDAYEKESPRAARSTSSSASTATGRPQPSPWRSSSTCRASSTWPPPEGTRWTTRNTPPASPSCGPYATNSSLWSASCPSSRPRSASCATAGMRRSASSAGTRRPPRTGSRRPLASA